MAIKFKCAGCDKVLKVASGYAGKRAKCPHCQTILTVPRPRRRVPITPKGSIQDMPFVEPAVEVAEPVVEEAPAEPSPPEPAPLPKPVIVAHPTLFVFSPVRDIRFPDHCVGCFAESPAEVIVLDVRLAMPPRGGPEHAVEQYHMPICPECRKMLPPGQIRDLAGHSDGMVDAARVTTRFLTREIRNQCVLLTLRNAELVDAFAKANKGKTFNSIAACHSWMNKR